MMRIFIAGFVCMLCLSLQTFAQNKEGYGNDGGGQQGNPSEVIIDETGKNSGEANNKPLVRDGAYDKISIDQKQFLSYDHIREADVFWQKRIWRVIDTRQKLNQTFTTPTQPFISVLLEIIKQNPDKVKLFMDDNFTAQLSLAEVDKQLGSVDTITTYDLETGNEIKKIVKNDFNWTSVTKFRLKEDWIFDKEASEMVVRILAIAPIRDVIDQNGNYRGTQAMFWAYYPDMRPFLIKKEAFNVQNDSQKMTWDDIMEMRLFSSYIMKESNVHDRRIEEYARGKDALLESERVKEEIFLKEHGLWSY
ncbi:MAG: gliding motility protein GldN [Sphingobacteriales bacterium]|jgi:gliding motility associated protien GldN|nr:gliding motility protein GldN [Sphingobacteriales bacterium]MBP9140142.1 gliding motility protein GldN [Chitinophagales bacterium]MDA0198255.1 gliding motility protein GldN [Bacteroidota bacterium]MBK7527473.1 gliding motility protein GldN [Sphingobacteriales bacterium]MBK8678181.1 gliding motility protein GldN [Sphingobacteriales bacterium]